MSTTRESAETEHSGRLLLRMPKTLHGELARAAEREGTSLNRLIVTRLSHSLGDTAKPQPRVPSSRPELRRPVLRYTFVANLVVLVVAATAAVTLLVAVYRS